MEIEVATHHLDEKAVDVEFGCEVDPTLSSCSNRIDSVDDHVQTFEQHRPNDLIPDLVASDAHGEGRTECSECESCLDGIDANEIRPGASSHRRCDGRLAHTWKTSDNDEHAFTVDPDRTATRSSMTLCVSTSAVCS